MEANDMKAMREACQKMLDLLMLRGDGNVRCVLTWDEFNESQKMLRAALSKPPRQCDVGTADEQMKRQYETMCNTTNACPDSDWSCRKCFAKWAQTPYVAERKGEDDGSK